MYDEFSLRAMLLLTEDMTRSAKIQMLIADLFFLGYVFLIFNKFVGIVTPDKNDDNMMMTWKG